MDDLPPPAPPANSPPTRWPWLLGVLPLGVGAYLGYEAAYQSSLPGFSSMGGAFIAFGIGALVLVAALVGFANSLRPYGRGRRASRYAFIAAGMIAAGGAGGAAAVTAFDLGYHDPVILEARGTASVSLERLAEFEPRSGGEADCRSVADGRDVAEVVALSLGELDHGTLRARLQPPVSPGAVSSIELWIDGADLPSGAEQPFWSGQADAVEVTAGGETGSVQFAQASIQFGAGGAVPSTNGGGLDIGWPATLSGELSWSCGAWFDPSSTPPSAVGAEVALEIDGQDWIASGAGGTCEFEADGSVWTVATDEAGLLQGEAVTVSLDLRGAPQAGDEVILMLQVRIPDASQSAWTFEDGAVVAATSGRGIPYGDLVTLEEIANGGRSGRASFDLPQGGTLDADWPARLSGMISWTCG